MAPTNLSERAFKRALKEALAETLHEQRELLHGLGIVLGILTLIPCIGLIVLLVINGKATGVLRENGIGVGLLGANLSKL